MKTLYKIIALATVSMFYNIKAQQEITKKDTLSGTELTMVMDSRIHDAIENLEDKCNNKPKFSNSGTVSSPIPERGPSRVLVPNRALSTAEICRQNPRILGIKIQLAVVKSNKEANKVKAYFRSKFPNIKVETDASLRPNYKILAGSYFNKQNASGDLSRIRQYFKSAIPVQYRIFCAEAK